MSGQQQLPEDKRAWLQELDIGVEATQLLADAWGEDGDMRGLSVGALSLMLSTRNDLAMKAFTNRGVSPLVVEALIVRLQHAAGGRGGDGAAVVDEERKVVLCTLDKIEATLRGIVAEERKVEATLRGIQTLIDILAVDRFPPGVQGVSIVGQGFSPVCRASAGKAYRKKALTYYGHSLDTDKITCMVTGKEVEANKIKAAHIYRRKGWSTNMILALNKDVNDEDNILFMIPAVKGKFDKFDFCIIPYNENDFKIKVLRPELLEHGSMMYIGTGADDDNVKWSDVDGKCLALGEGSKRPARRLLAFHASIAVKHAVLKGWQVKDAVVIPAAGWESPGYDVGMMDRFLAGSQAAMEGHAESTQESLEGASVAS